MSNDVSAALASALKDRVFAAMAGSAPDINLEERLAKEVKAYFEEPTNFTLEEHDKPGWSSEPSKLKMVVRMTPFRQMVWSAVAQYIKPIMEEAFKNESSALRAELDTWAAEIGRKNVGEQLSTIATKLAVDMAAIQQAQTLHSAVHMAHNNLIASMQQLGMDTSKVAGLQFLNQHYPLR